MQKSLRTAVFGMLAIAIVPAFAQQPGRSDPDDSVFGQVRRAQERMEMAGRAGRARRVSEAESKRREALRRKQEFARQLGDFAHAWNAFISTGTNGDWNCKRAKAARKAFMRLTRSEGWIEERE